MRGFEDADSPLVVVHGYDVSGTCAFCRKEVKEGVLCTFDGGRFEGFLCRNDFWKFLRLGSESRAPRPEGETPPFNDGRAAIAEGTDPGSLAG